MPGHEPACRLPNEMLLDRKKRNDLFETVEQCNVDPADFEVSWQDRQVELKHRHSSAQFKARSMAIGPSDADWAVEWVAGQPKEEIKKEKYQDDFGGVLKEVPRWLKAIEADEAVPDRWAELDVVPE